MIRGALAARGAIGAVLAGANGIATLVYDTFTGANGTALTSHTPDKGGAWTQHAGTFYIQSNALQPNSFSDGDHCTLNAGAADFRITATLTPFDSGSSARSYAGLLFRYSDANNFWLLQLGSFENQIQLYKRVAGTYTLVSSQSVALDAGTAYTVQVVTSGEQISYGLVGGTITELTGQTAHYSKFRVGFRAGKTGSPGTRPSMDNLRVLPNNPYGWASSLTRYASNPIVPKGTSGTWDDSDVANPDVFYDTPNARWVMNYSGYDGATWHTGLAYSNDLLTWTKEAANPVLSPDGDEGYIAANGSICLFEGTYYLFYQVQQAQPRICVASSSDLLTWTRLNSGSPIALGSSGQFDDAGQFDPFARVVGGVMELTYCAYDGAARNVGRMTTTDGVTFTRLGQIAAGTGVSTFGEPSVLGSGSAYSIFHENDGRVIRQMITRDGGATYLSAQILGAGSGWDSVQVFDSYPVLHNGTLYMFYAGANLPGSAQGLNAQIGVATMPYTSESP